MSMRLERDAASMMPSKFVSLANRGSPPGTSDCSGSHCLPVPLNVMVLTPARRSAPPMASTALLTRLCSGVCVAQEARKNALDSATHASFMTTPLPGGGANRLGQQGAAYNYSFFGAGLAPAAALGCCAGVEGTEIRLNSERLMRPSPSRSMAIQLRFLASAASSSSRLRCPSLLRSRRSKSEVLGAVEPVAASGSAPHDKPPGHKSSAVASASHSSLDSVNTGPE